MLERKDFLKVLLLSPLPPPAGGIATWTKLFIDSSIIKENTVEVVDTSIIGNRIKNLGRKRLFEEAKRAVMIYKKTSKQLKEGYDIFHINSSCSKFGMIRDYLCLKVAKKQNTKIVIHFHCDTSYMVKGKVATLVFTKLCKEADKIFCLNKSSAQHVEMLSTKVSRIIPNFIDIVNVPINPKIASKEIKNVIFVGHVLKSKGCVDIISIAKQLPQINFKLIGKVSNEIELLPKPENLKLYGELLKEEVYNHMLKADILLFPTYTEGFPNVVLEAMVCGLPIISTPVGAIPEILSDKGGTLVNVGDINGFIKAIKDLNKPEVRKQISDWNQEKVMKSYTVDKVLKIILKEYYSM